MIGERPAELADPDCLAPGESEALLAGHPWRRFVVLGDSVANGPLFPVEGYCPLRWTDRVAAELRAAAPDLRYLNLGVSGLLAREVRASQLDQALEFEPDLALVLCGGNDAFRPSYAGTAAEAVTDEIGAILQALRSAGAQPATIGIFDVSYSPAIPERHRLPLRERLALLAEHARLVASRHDCVHVDLSRHPRASDPTLYSPDGRHGNARSDAIAAAEMVRGLGARLRASRAQPATMAKPSTSAPIATFITNPPPG
ncbi:MAG TPA: SGNH/GDSL hydrolase family protein [Jatrophihabitans sp.]